MQRWASSSATAVFCNCSYMRWMYEQFLSTAAILLKARCSGGAVVWWWRWWRLWGVLCVTCCALLGAMLLMFAFPLQQEVPSVSKMPPSAPLTSAAVFAVAIPCPLCCVPRGTMVFNMKGCKAVC
jgi:hypothetical protein